MLDVLNRGLIRLSQSLDTSTINLPNKTTDPGAVTTRIEVVLQIVFVTMGAISVLIIAIAGLQYVMSGGDPQKTARAKDTILYALIGLIVAILAFTIVTFVLGRLF